MRPLVVDLFAGAGGPAPLPASAKRSALALVKVTPAERMELEAWAKAKRTPLATLLREAGLNAARRLVRGGGR